MTDYEIIGEHAFTKENSLIYNIRVDSKIRFDDNINTVKDYFQKYGIILDVQFVEGALRQHVYLVYFASPKSAAKALLGETNDATKSSKFIVRALDRFYQPDGRRFFEQLTASLEINCSQAAGQEALLLHLSDDCLVEICRNLSLKDQIKFALTSHRFWNITEMVFRIEYASLDTERILKELTPFEARIFFEIVGLKIKTLNIKEFWNDNYLWTLLHLVSQFCLKVKKLEVLSTFDTKQQFITLIEKMPLLEELDLTINFKENFFEYLIALKNLKNLRLLIFPYIYCNKTFDNLNMLCDLEKLSLVGWFKLSSLQFRNICKNLKKLKHLQLGSCTNLGTEDYQYMVDQLKQLKSLVISSSRPKLNPITQLPNLKQLKVGCHDLSDDFFSDLSKFKADQLEELKLYTSSINMARISLISELKKLKVLHYECDPSTHNDISLAVLSQLTELEDILIEHCNITDVEVLQLLGQCLKLKSIRFHYCTVLTSDLANNALELIQNQHAHGLRTHRVEINMRIRVKTAMSIPIDVILDTDVLNYRCSYFKITDYISD